MALIPIYTAQNGTIIGVVKGTKPQSPYDFKVKYREPGRRERTPKHMHVAMDIYMKGERNWSLTKSMLDHIVNNITEKVRPIKSFPPNLQIFKPQHAIAFQALNKFGEYPVDFLLVIVELIQIQEITNYPDGEINLHLFTLLQNKANIFDVVSAATFRGNA